ncbi:MAG: Helicase associated domain protein [Actinomycetota bacterium]|nr:Helicase associated domain protein [Actinomycetota bacterium]MDA2949275.1 Helicase associated domain protein [Actinomycetota bacterium]MDA2990893.1 Helicase associated domain protein [Actinomycetota bacterium]
MGDFDALYASLSEDDRIRGLEFERVCKWFLENDPVYSHELKRVWLWRDWPGRWGGDAGIDLVGEDRNGELWAIQAKAYKPKYRVSKKDVDKFLSESGRKVFSYRMLIATTDLIDRTGERTIQQQEKRSSFFRLNDLRAASVDWPASPAQLRPARRRKPARPRPHQKKAIGDVVTGFGTSDRGQLVMACGSGKTLTSLFIAEKLQSKRTLVLLPSLSLLKQTLNEWRANAATDFVSLPVCSDDTVASTEDAAIAHTADLGVPVTTDPNEIAAFLRRKSGPLVVFSTYQSSPQIEAAFKLGRVPGFQLIVADEAHRVAGPVSSDFATVLDDRAIRGDRRLFMTATPRYFTGRVLKAAQEADFEVASMDDQEKFGSVFHRLSFGEAIERDLLTDYQVVIVGVDDATYRQWAEKGALVTRDGKTIDNAATLAGQIGLAKTMRKYDLRRVISFHSRIKRAQEFARDLPEVIAWMPARQRPKGRLWSDVATGEMPAGDRYMLLQHLGRLDDAERGLLANARCLSEGVDVPTLDGVAFIDPRRSEVDIIQAVGRAIRKSETKAVGTIVIPVFIDTDEDPEVALDSSVFKPVWDVIKALRAHDAELGERLDALRRQSGRSGGKPRLPDKIHLDVPATVGAAFAKAFDAYLVETTTAPWEFWYGLLEEYIARNGSADVPVEGVLDGYRLGGWCSNQRSRYQVGELGPDQIARLDELPGWTWNRNEGRWEAGLSHMLEYLKEHGDTLISAATHYNGYPLGDWAAIQRRDARAGKLSQARREALDAIPGWVWGLEDERWENGFRHLQQYIDEHGDSRVKQPYKSSDGFRLGAWVNFQRTRYAQGKLEVERVKRLTALPGWVWTALEARWNEAFEKLTQFGQEYGHVGVPIDYPVDDDGFNLRTWYANQRAKFPRLSADRQERLRALPGWDTVTNDGKWEFGFQQLLAYVRDCGDAKVERSHTVGDFPLGTWAMTQRLEFKRGQLSPDRVKRLAALPGWDWDRRGGKWEEAFSRISGYIKIHGHAPPNDYEEDGHRLGSWAAQQRLYKRTGKLSPERIRRLDGLRGWDWSPPRGAAARNFRRKKT